MHAVYILVGNGESNYTNITEYHPKYIRVHDLTTFGFEGLHNSQYIVILLDKQGQVGNIKVHNSMHKKCGTFASFSMLT